MGIVTRKPDGLFPAPDEIEIACSCPDAAGLCKHAAATLYGVGARLDRNPECLFALRGVDHLELVARAGDVAGLTQTPTAREIDAADLADIFGIDIAPSPHASRED